MRVATGSFIESSAKPLGKCLPAIPRPYARVGANDVRPHFRLVRKYPAIATAKHAMLATIPKPLFIDWDPRLGFSAYQLFTNMHGAEAAGLVWKNCYFFPPPGNARATPRRHTHSENSPFSHRQGIYS